MDSVTPVGLQRRLVLELSAIYKTSWVWSRISARSHGNTSQHARAGASALAKTPEWAALRNEIILLQTELLTKREFSLLVCSLLGLEFPKNAI